MTRLQDCENKALDWRVTWQQAVNKLVELESKTTQGEWIVRDSPVEEGQCIVERPRQEGERYGVEIMGEDTVEYPNKRADAEFIVEAKRLVLALKKGGYLPQEVDPLHC